MGGGGVYNLILTIHTCSLVNLYFPWRRCNQSKRHKKSVKIGVSLFILTIFCYTSVLIAANSNLYLSHYAFYLIYVNNFGNFFIYFWIDEKFRKYILRRKWFEIPLYASAFIRVNQKLSLSVHVIVVFCFEWRHELAVLSVLLIKMNLNSFF